MLAGKDKKEAELWRILGWEGLRITSGCLLLFIIGK